MAFKMNPRPALTNVAWELQRRAYVRNEADLNPEFARFKSLGGISIPSNVEVDYTLPAHPEPREVIHLPRSYRYLRVYTGSAWVTYNAKDHFLKPGDEMCFDRDSQSAVISCVGKETLNFQISQ